MPNALQRLGDKITLGLDCAKLDKVSTVSPWISSDGVIKTDKPLLVIHGTADESVPYSAAENIANACQHAVLLPVQDQSHTFGVQHPLEHLGKAPIDFWDVLENTKEFLEDSLEDYYLD